MTDRVKNSATTSLVADACLYEIKVDDEGNPILDNNGEFIYIWKNEEHPDESYYDVESATDPSD